MKIYLLLIVTLLLTSGAVAAREVKDKGGYVGGAVGVTTFEDDDALVGTFDDSDTSLQIYGGYKFLRYFALEGRLLNLGTYGTSSLEVEATAVTVNAIGIVPLGGSNWDFFGQLGFGQINLDPSTGQDEDETVASGGIGFRVTPTEHFSVALQIDVYAWEQEILGQTFDWSIGASQVAFQYNF